MRDLWHEGLKRSFSSPRHETADRASFAEVVTWCWLIFGVSLSSATELTALTVEQSAEKQGAGFSLGFFKRLFSLGRRAGPPHGGTDRLDGS